MEYKLIMAVSGFPSLYDSSCLTYRDLNMRSDAWRQVAEIVGVPGECVRWSPSVVPERPGQTGSDRVKPESECRRKWKMLRDQHRRERQREKERRESGVGLLNYRPWRYSAILSFLNPFIDARAAGTNGWALDPQPLFQMSDMMGCSTTMEVRSDDDENYGECTKKQAAGSVCLDHSLNSSLCAGLAVADATTTTTSSSSSSEFAQRKRPSSPHRDAVRLKEAKLEASSESPAADDCVQVQHVNMKELFEMMMQSVTSLATTLASSHSSSQPSDQLTPPSRSSPAILQPDLQSHCSPPPSCTASRLNHLKTEEQEAVVAEPLDQRNGEEECHSAAPRSTRAWRRSTDSLLEEYLRRMEAREAQRDRDMDQRDDVTLFLLSLAPTMRRLPAEKQSWVRTKIQQFLHEAEFGPTNFQ
ncbi:Transcription factor [Collichthys lucidus]|uniref:Transcription factor n=1 Tax=Collichthys lucidus TaxID=240159 RepID=A0A4U5UKF1_COLLU|nr:Transcription factor [Collichthys lucidus]